MHSSLVLLWQTVGHLPLPSCHLLDLAPKGLPGHLDTAPCAASSSYPVTTHSTAANAIPTQPLKLLVQAAAEPVGCQA